MKRIGIIIILLIFIFVFIPMKTVSADSGACLIIYSNSYAKQGETLVLDVYISGSDMNVSGVQGVLQYDQSVFELQNYSVAKSGWFVSSFNQNTGAFLIEMQNIADTQSVITKTEELIKLQFLVKQDAPIGYHNITISNVVAAGVTMNSNIENKTIQVLQNENYINNNNNTNINYVQNSQDNTNKALAKEYVQNAINTAISEALVGNDGANTSTEWFTNVGTIYFSNEIVRNANVYGAITGANYSLKKLKGTLGIEGDNGINGYKYWTYDNGVVEVYSEQPIFDIPTEGAQNVTNNNVSNYTTNSNNTNNTSNYTNNNGPVVYSTNNVNTQNSQNSQNTSSYSSQKTTPKSSDKNVPYTGMDDSIVCFIIAGILITGVSLFGYIRYRDIK